MRAPRWSSLALLSSLSLAFGCGADLDLEDGAIHPLDPATKRDLARLASAVTCNASMKKYPVNGKHNGGWDPNALTYTCPPHPSSSKDNSDFIAGDHFGNDIFAAKGTALVACVDGTIVNVSNTSIGGLNVTIKDKCGWYYYYAHMNKIAADIKEGLVVSAGKYLGELGNTGNASGTSPHLHFSIYPGTYNLGIDPFPLLQSVDAGACGDTPPPPPEGPKIDISSVTSLKDTRPEGSSKDIGDTFEGDTFTVDVIVKNSGTNTSDYVQIGYWIEAPWIDLETYTIYTDWPAKDGKTWKVNDSDSAPGNPPKANPPKEGKINIYAMGSGETKKIAFKVKAVEYSLGAVDHPDVRAWVWHVGGYYGEMTGFYDEVETNKAGKLLRTYEQSDVYGKTHWEWNATKPETEGWSIGNAVSELAVNTVDHCLAAKQAGKDPSIHSPDVSLKAGTWKGIELRARSYEGLQQGQLFWITSDDGTWNEAKSVHFESAGDKQFHKLVVNASTNPLWKGTITRLRLDPSKSGENWFDIDWLRAAANPGATTGDADGDGVVASLDCNDQDAAIGPSEKEICNDKDDDCDGQIDEDFGQKGPEICDGKDNDCDGAVDDGVTNACGGCGDVPVEACNGKDDNCDGTLPPDESDADQDGFMVCAGDCNDGDASIHPGADDATACNGVDNDCDGLVDEGLNVGAACTVGIGGCSAVGVVSCVNETDIVCSATAGTPVGETCDGKDNDCDGTTDEDFGLGVPCEKVNAACVKKGITVCSADGATTVCNAQAPVPTDETCNGEDDDCDGDTDEGYGLADACTKGSGDCAVSGYMACGEDGKAFCKAPVPEGSAERCDGQDNDCDELVDEGFPVGEDCTVWQGDCELTGAWVCDPTGLGTDCAAPELAPGAPCPGDGGEPVTPPAGSDATGGDPIGVPDAGGTGAGQGGDAAGHGATQSGSSDDGCASAAAPASPIPAWLLLLAFTLLAVSRRRA